MQAITPLSTIRVPWYVIRNWELLCPQFERETLETSDMSTDFVFDQMWGVL
jgi:hypothetical protein